MISALLNVPHTAHEWEIWSFNHQSDTLEIQQALIALGVPQQQYQLDPMPPNDIENWLQREQQSHNNFNGPLNLQGVDLSSVDFSDRRQLEAWIWLDYLEHQTARIALGI